MKSLPHRDQSVDVAGLLLAVSPHPGHGLLVVGWVPVGVKHDQAVGADQIEATPPRLAAQHEDELGVLWDTNVTLHLRLPASKQTCPPDSHVDC